MSAIHRRVIAAAGTVLAVVALAACTSSGGKHSTSGSANPKPGPSSGGVPTLAQSTPTGTGAGSATLTLAGKKTSFPVLCSRATSGIRATGNSGNSALTLTVTGKPLSAVLVSHDGGNTVIYQALAGLRDDAGKAEGKITVAGGGSSYQGSGTFVITQLDSKGKRVKLTKNTSRDGSFTLSCPQGYAKVTPPKSLSAKPSTKPS